MHACTSIRVVKINENESINKMITHFMHIINQCKALENAYTNVEMVRKILGSLPNIWRLKVIAIQEGRDLNALSLDVLIGPLKTN